MNLDLGLRRQFTWNFIIVELDKPVIGTDFIAHYGLLVDCRSGRLLDSITTLSTPGAVTDCQVSNIKAVTGNSGILC